MSNGKPLQNSPVTNVGCDVRNCKYNENGGKYCTAANIQVENRSAVNKGETFCNTFAPKASC